MTLTQLRHEAQRAADVQRQVQYLVHPRGCEDLLPVITRKVTDSDHVVAAFKPVNGVHEIKHVNTGIKLFDPSGQRTPGQRGKPPVAMEAAKQAILSLLSDGQQRTTEEIRQALACSHTNGTIDKAHTLLRQGGQIIGVCGDVGLEKKKKWWRLACEA